MAFALLMLQSTWAIAIAFVPTTNQRPLVHNLRYRSKAGGAARGHFWEQYHLPSRYFPTNLRLLAAANDDNDGVPKDIPVTEKIQWIFDEADGDFWDDEDEEEDDSFFDDLFLTDDEDDGSIDSGGNDGPDVSLNENDLMQLHDISPDLLMASPLPTNTTVSTNDSSTSASSTTSISTNNTAVSAMEMNQATSNMENSDVSTLSVDNILASLESDLTYFYLRDELGIPEDVMWKITNDAPSVLGLKANNVRNKVQVLQSLVGLTDAEIRQLITSQPTLLQLSVKKNLSPTILFWIRQLEIGKEELKTLILGCPTLLKYSRSNIQGKLNFFQTTMGYSLSDCRKLLVKEPRLLTSGVKTGLIPRLNFLTKEVEISLPNIRKIALKNPRILLMSVEQNLTPKCVFYFIMTLQMEGKDVEKMLLKYPQILDYNLEHHILPIHHYFLSLDFSTYEFSRILQRYPRLITYSLMRIKRRIGYLRFELYLEANAIRRILYQCPQIVSLGTENLERSVEFLLQAVAPDASLQVGGSEPQLGGKDYDEHHEASNIGNGSESDDMVDTDDRNALTIVQILIAGLPTLVSLSIDNNLRPKVDYLREKLGQEELSNGLLRMPALLGYSLENRIRPRLEKILNAKIPVGKLTVGITLKEDAFDQWLERQIQNKNTAARSGRSTARTVSKPNNSVESSVVATAPIVDRIEEATTEETENGDDAGPDNGNSRVVEEGGKIIHWRR
jgi:mTERF domain-containing protein